jgi:hypothetical protein
MLKKIRYKENQIYYGILIVIALIGIILRIGLYLINTDCYLDEYLLAHTFFTHHNIFAFNIGTGQKAPIIYLLITKINILLFGTSERAFRLCSILSGILSIPLFHIIVSKIFKKRQTIILSELLFAINPYLIFFSNTIKQYSFEALITLIILYFLLNINIFSCKKNTFIYFLFVIVLCGFSSFPFHFIIWAFIFSTLIFNFKGTNINRIIMITGSACISSIYCFLNYLTEHSAWFVDYWQEMTLNDFGVGFLNPNFLFFYMFNYHNFMCIFLNSLINGAYIFGEEIETTKFQIITLFILTGIGLILLIKENYKRYSFILFTILLGYIGSLARIYPFTERLTVYIIPIYIILLAKPCEYIRFNIYGKSIIKKTIVFLISTILIFSYIFAFYTYRKDYPAYIKKNIRIFKEKNSPRYRIYPVIEYINQQKEQGTVVLLGVDYLFINEFYLNLFFKNKKELDYCSVYNDSGLHSKKSLLEDGKEIIANAERNRRYYIIQYRPDDEDRVLIQYLAKHSKEIRIQEINDFNVIDIKI